ncbi:MAG: DUF86 domain-containing protein [Chloroflexi bacterium]|nr:DUF86 domain-containing protein [Chloroflexota bacterium]
MIDREIIERKLGVIEDNLALLTRLSSLEDAEFDSDFRNLYTAVHLLQMCVEAMLDCVDHVISRLRLGTPSDGREALLVMASQGLMPASHVETYLAMNAFRNRVVHLYNDVSPEEVKHILRMELDDFRMFIADMRTVVALHNES